MARDKKPTFLKMIEKVLWIVCTGIVMLAIYEQFFQK